MGPQGPTAELEEAKADAHRRRRVGVQARL
jgi:hypothetical protein